ncbi:bifunctional metallophosphatase/5'-nucleotidase [Deinococcus sonorensis]|uniref:Bifunctional metallophosphatase/5'-nucleotidase n=2 Tax=Deinococcus sonorensis TaxID=309891 RepID=A0AAU7UEJ5_9DEIO
MKKNVMLVSLVLGLSACSNLGNKPTTTDVTVLGLNDFHGNLEPTGFAGKKIPDPKDSTKTINLPTGGAAIIGGYVDSVRAKNANTLFVGAGDLIGASPVTSSLLRDEPTIIAMTKMGMKVSSLGNHEFDQGLKELLRMQNGGCDSNDTTKACKFQNPYPKSGFRYLGANVVYHDTLKPVFDPYEIETTKSGAKVAFIGAVLKGTPDIVSPEGIKGLDFLDEAASINKYIPELKAKKVDAIFVLIHQGGTSPDGYAASACTTLTGPIVDIANAIDPAVSVIISGHTHQGYNCKVGDKTVIQGDFYGHLLQRVDLKLDLVAHKVLNVTAANVIMDASADTTIPKSQDLSALVTKAKGLTDTIKLTPIAKIAAPSISKTQNAAGESALGDVIADSQLYATSDASHGSAQIAFMNPGGIRADLLPSAANNTVTFGDTYTVQPFGNTLTVMTLTGAQIKTVLEQQWQGQSNGPRILQVSKGFTYSYDLSKPDGSKVDAASIKLNGTVVNPTSGYRVVVNNFIAGGGDSFVEFKNGTNVLQQPNLADVDAFNAYLKANEPLATPAQDRIIKLGQ